MQGWAQRQEPLRKAEAEVEAEEAEAEEAEEAEAQLLPGWG